MIGKVILIRIQVLRIYITFKSVFKLEEYLVTKMDFKLGHQLAKFRLSSYTLLIEKGRLIDPKFLLRIDFVYCTFYILATMLHKIRTSHMKQNKLHNQKWKLTLC